MLAYLNYTKRNMRKQLQPCLQLQSNCLGLGEPQLSPACYSLLSGPAVAVLWGSVLRKIDSSRIREHSAQGEGLALSHQQSLQQLFWGGGFRSVSNVLAHIWQKF